MPYILRKTLYNVELIEYCDPSLSRSSQSGLASLSVDSEGRDYTVQNGRRAHAKVIEYGSCNPWTYFCTFTFSPRNFDRSDSDRCAKSLLTFLDNLRSRHDPSLRYVLVPEPHPTSGMIHFHGLIYTDDVAVLSKALDLKYIKSDIRSGRKCLVYKSTKILEKFGRNSFTKIALDSIACTYYITKYIQKSDDQLLSHRYYCSQGLSGYSRIKSIEDPDVATRLRGFLFSNAVQPCFVNQYLRKWVFPGSVTFEQILSGSQMSDDDLEFYNRKRMESLVRQKIPLSFDDKISIALFDTLSLSELIKVSPDTHNPFPEDFLVQQPDFFDDLD